MSVKEAAHPAIEALPDTASLQDAADRVALLAALEKGRHAVREGRWRSPEEVEKLLSSWLEKQSQTSLSDPKPGGMKSRFSSPGFAEKIHWARDAGD